MSRKRWARAVIALAGALLLFGSHAVGAADESAVLKAIVAARWRLPDARKVLPPVQLVHAESLEFQNFVQYAFDGGALRLDVSPGDKGGDIFAILVDTRVPKYRGFAALASTKRYGVYRDGGYVVVVPRHPVSRALFEKLKGREWTDEGLEGQLGAPSYRWHVHGIGYLGVTYVPQGLSFIGNHPGPNAAAQYQVYVPDLGCDVDLPPLAAAARVDLDPLQRQVRETFAKEILRQRVEIDAALARGRRSPDGRFVVGHVNLGGLANTEEVVFGESGKPERRYPAPRFTGDDDYLWLDARTVVFKVFLIDVDFYVMDAVTGASQLVAKEPDRSEDGGDSPVVNFGVSGPQRFWYKTANGVTHDVTVPSATPTTSQ